MKLGRLVLFVIFSAFSISVFAQDSDARLKERLDGSWAVITGKVVNVKKVTGVQGDGMSEHSPDWYCAEIKVGSVLKGMVRTTVRKTFKMYFPASMDITQFRHPKFKKGQEGIWLLRFTDDVNLKKYDVNAKVALDPLDFQAVDQESKIKDLLRK